MNAKRFLIVVSAATLLTACSSSKKQKYYQNPYGVTQQTQSQQYGNSPYGSSIEDNKSIKYWRKSPATRAYGMGQSARESAATQIAEQNARGKIASAIESAVVSASKTTGLDLSKYANGTDDGQQATDGMQRNYNMVKSVANATLNNTIVVESDRLYNSKNKMFTIFVCVEYQGGASKMAKDIAKQVKDHISEEDRQKIDRDLTSFEEEIGRDLAKQSESH